MTKIISFEQSYESLIKLAIYANQSNDFEKGIRLLYTAIKKSPKIAKAYIILAETYSEMLLYDLSNQVLFSLLKIHSKNDEAYILLSHNFLEMNEVERAGFYIKRYSEVSKFSDLDFEFSDEDEPPVELSLAYPLNKNAVNRLLIEVKDNISKGEYTKAYKILLDLHKAFSKDVIIINNCTLVNILLNDNAKALEFCMLALEIENTNILANSNLTILYYILDEKKNLAKQIDILSNLEVAGQADMFKVISTLCEVKADRIAEAKIKDYLKLYPFDMQVSMFDFFVKYNTKNFESAKNSILKILAINPNDTIAKYYLDYVNNAVNGSKKAKNKLIVSPQIVEEDFLKYVLVLTETPDFIGVWNNEDMLNKIFWAVETIKDDNFIIELLTKLSLSNRVKVIEYFKKLMIDDGITTIVKREVFKLLLCLGERGKFAIVKDGFFCEINVPKNLPFMIIESVATAIGYVSYDYIFEDNFVKKINEKSMDIQSQIIENDIDLLLIKPNVLACIIVKVCGFEIEPLALQDIFATDFNEIAKIEELIFDI